MTTEAHNANTAAGTDLDAISQTTQRENIKSLTVALLSTGQLYLTGIYLPGGVVVSNISFRSGDTALATGSNQWFCIYDLARAKQCVTADDTSTAWGPNATKTLAVSGGWVVPSSGRYYVGIMVKATTVPTLATTDVIAGAVMGITPVRAGLSSTGLTDPASAPATAAAITYTSYVPLAWMT